MNDLQERIDELEVRVRTSLAALEVAMRLCTICPECHRTSYGMVWTPHAHVVDTGLIFHADDCIIGMALSMPPQDIGEK